MIYKLKIDMRFFNVKVSDVIQIVCAAIIIWCNWSVHNWITAMFGFVTVFSMSGYLALRVNETRDVGFIKFERRESGNDESGS